MARTFPTPDIWRSLTSARGGVGGSNEFKALNAAFLTYTSARTVKAPSGQSISDEYNELKRTYDAYMAKKAANADKLHLLGTVDRDGHGILQALGNFLSSTPMIGISEQDELAMIDYTFQRTLRLKTSLANARVELKPSSYLEAFKAACTALEKINQKGVKATVFGNKSLIEELREKAAQKQTTTAPVSLVDRGAALAQTGQAFHSQASSTVEAVSKASDSLFERHVAEALQVEQNAVFTGMLSAAQQVLGPDRYREIVGLIPVLSTVVGAAKVAKGFYDAATAYRKLNECGAVRKEIVAAGDPNTAFLALEKLLDQDFKRATQAAAEGAVAFAASFDPTQTASTVVGAATAVAHLFQDMVSFGLNYYQMLAVNEMLAQWSATPIDGEMSIAFGLKSASKVRDEIKARRAAGVDLDQFGVAMRRCPLLGAYFISSLPALDLLEMVAADLSYNSQSSFFQMYLDINSERVQRLVDSAKKVLTASRFRVVQNREALHQLRGSMEAENVRRHQTMHTERAATLNAFATRHVEEQKKREQAHKAAILALLEARQKEEAEAAARLADLARRSAEVEQERLLARREAISKAVAIYKAETGGIHRLHTVRNSESDEARAVLKALIQAGSTRQTLVTLDSVASYLISLTDRPAEYPALRPLRDASRLKHLLKEHYGKAP